MECSSNRLAISRLKDELRQLESQGKKLQSQLDCENDACGKLERDNTELEELLQTLKGKTSEKSNEISSKLNSLKSSQTQLSTQAAEYRNQLFALKTDMEKQRGELKKELRSVEINHIATNNKLEQLEKQFNQAKTAEQERLRMLMAKSKLLNSLAEKEDLPCEPSLLKKDFSKILRTNPRSRSSGRFSKTAVSKL